MEFSGCLTAIVTPFEGSGIQPPIDWSAFQELLTFQEVGGIDGIVVCGTTGESPTLSHQEHQELIEVAVQETRVPILAGTGSNSTWEAIDLTRHAEDVGAAGSLQVCPYYNRPNQEGLFRHFAAIAEAVEFPLILYDIPSRTGRAIAPETMARLHEEYSHIIGVKEAVEEEAVWGKIREACGKDFLLLSGNDGDTRRMMERYGARGVVSVASNLLPGEMAEFTALGLRGDFRGMEERERGLKELFEVLFIEPNPIPLKAAMAMRGLPAGGYRLPLSGMPPEKRKLLEEVLRRLGIL
jgi:4-hydroxy-tetrahydrodipicolinate synthase